MLSEIFVDFFHVWAPDLCLMSTCLSVTTIMICYFFQL